MRSVDEIAWWKEGDAQAYSDFISPQALLALAQREEGVPRTPLGMRLKESQIEMLSRVAHRALQSEKKLHSDRDVVQQRTIGKLTT